jgi:hypothetical protein
VELVLAVAAVLLMLSAWVGRPKRDRDSVINSSALDDVGIADAILVPHTIRQTPLL